MEAISLVALYSWCGLIAKPLRISIIVDKVNHIVDCVSDQRESAIHQTEFLKTKRHELFKKWDVCSRVEFIRDSCTGKFVNKSVLVPTASEEEL